MEQPKLLIVDDEEIVHRSCRRIFRGCNYQLEHAYSGEEALEKLAQGQFDIVITDLMMPGMSGMELLERLVRERPDLTVIIFTGYATVDSARRALKMGAFDYIPKPFTPDELRQVVQNALEARRKGGPGQALDLMAIISHDLRSPLATVQASAETLYKGYFGELEPQQRKALEAILRNCQYLEDIIRSFLDLQNVTLDNLESFARPVKLASEVVEPVLQRDDIAGNFRNMRITRVFEVDPQVLADPELMQIVVANLLTNAVKYGRDGGEIRVRVWEADGEARVSVWNTGVGIPREAFPRLFEMRTRLKQKGTEGVKGNGLGLYICKTIVEKHGGKIWVDSEPGQWAEFTFALPLRN
ncbi:MAG TPA: response regulator [Acidobacteriota bacterium]|nr:response regulator [Acidobacteriota bacterium]HRR26359.1 response regulator [Acidobacteriota bacterium]HRR56182.1 response regulator [Acidobacteriota bacterium]HRV07626.1 response regulator [Acidobacteriota bacterium]